MDSDYIQEIEEETDDEGFVPSVPAPGEKDKYLANCMSGTSRHRIQNAAEAEMVLVNGQPVKSNYKVKPGDTIAIVLDYPKNDFSITPQEIPLNVV